MAAATGAATGAADCAAEAAGAAAGGDSKAPLTLDPYQCITKRNRKYASECREVYLAKMGAEAMSDNFEHFNSLEVVWLTGNRLSRIEHLETNFRIREVYVQDNRLVSLSGIRNFKFLRVLLASNNQLRNLDKQLAVLSRFSFLKKLDLFDNPVAEEPDYRLRLTYHVPQVEILDRHAVKGPERLKADEVVPNLNKVSAARTEKAKQKPPWADHSALERSCFRMAKDIRARRLLEADAALGQAFSKGVDGAAPLPEARSIRENRERWLASVKPQGDEVLDGTAAAQTSASAGRPEVFASTLRKHLASGANHRGDLFTQTLLPSRREVDEATGRQLVKVCYKGRATAIGG